MRSLKRGGQQSRSSIAAISEQVPQIRQVLLEGAGIDNDHALARSQGTDLGERLERRQARGAFWTDPPALVAPDGAKSSFDFRFGHRYGAAATRTDDFQHLEMADTTWNVETYTERLPRCNRRAICGTAHPRVDDWRGC